ncbi:unnamed protein product [Blepharisma stoltei]|uniref:Large ribosomal subunit protein uL10-like insertion domain-containing protein n=1 Tax=Blepharisma stoltei TaxID=1481888 RepID=A0AAU9JBE4_9CILI|nr:unnamed protein product [Blepharisma stoltei]
MSKREKKIESDECWFKLWQLTEEYPVVLICNCFLVGNTVLSQLRSKIRGKGVMLFGKNTLIRAGLKKKLEILNINSSCKGAKQTANDWQRKNLEVLIRNLQGKVCMIFCKEEFLEVIEIVNKITVQRPARLGEIAPADVYTVPGPTDLDPTKTCYFAVYNIATKISKGKIEIVNKAHIIKKGQAIQENDKNMLEHIGIHPFTSKLEISHVVDHGKLLSSSVITMDKSLLIQKFCEGAKTITALSLEIGFPIPNSIPLSISKGVNFLSNLASLSNYSLKKTH